MSTVTRRPGLQTQQQRTTALLLVVLVPVLAAWAILAAGNTMAGEPTEGLLAHMIFGNAEWLPEHTTITTGVLVAATVLIPAWYFADRAIFGPRRPITRAAKHMCSPWQARHLDARHRAKEIRRKKGSDYQLLFLGYLGRTRRKLFFGPEDTFLGITGPRWNKSSSIASPAIITAPGACLGTANKPDLVQDTIEFRDQDGVYIFDPQNIYREHTPNPMWWNPLTSILEAEDERKAEAANALAKRFFFASGSSMGNDSHWDKSAVKIMGSVFLAAAIGGLDIIDCYRFVMSPGDTRPVDILEADGRYPLEAQALDEYSRTTERQRAGEYAGAKTALQFVGYGSVRKWVTPSPGRQEFRPSMMFDHDAPTLYLLSQEGEGSTGPLTAALTIAVYEAAVQEALRHGGRLPVPMMMVLDEVANVCRWEALPDLYTHMGGRGILPIALLQSYPQGKQVWGEERMAQLLSNSSIYVAGGNTKGDSYHSSIVNMVKKTSRLVTSSSSSRQGRSESTSEQQIDTIDIADVRELPKEYSLLFVGGMPSIVLRHVPVWKRRLKKKPVHTEPEVPRTSAPVIEYKPDTEAARPRRQPSGWAVTLEEDD